MCSACVGWDSGAVVFHVDLHCSIGYPGSHLDRRVLGRVLMRIGNQVHQYLANPVRLDFDQRQIGVDPLGQDLAAGVGLGAHRPHHVFDQRAEAGRLRADREAPGVGAREVEQIVQQPHQVAAVVEDDLDRLHLPWAERVAVHHQQLGEALDRGQRAAQLVRRGQHELVFHPVELVALGCLELQFGGHFVERVAERRGLREAADLDPRRAVAARRAVPPPRPAPRAAAASRRSGRRRAGAPRSARRSARRRRGSRCRGCRRRSSRAVLRGGLLRVRSSPAAFGGRTPSASLRRATISVW